MNTQQSLTPDKPVYVYFATGATHAPHHAPKSYVQKYKGKFSQGWDELRRETLERQKKLGVVPQGTVLAPKPADIKDWADLTADEKRLFERQMEVFAGFAEHTDHEVGRLVAALEARGELDNTLLFYIVGDNGSSASTSWAPSTPTNHFAAGWAVAGNTPFTWTKQVASNFGGTRNGMVLHWPAGIKAKNEVRSQFHHVIDVAPTVYGAVGVPAPRMVNGIEQRPMEGVAMNYSFDDAGAADMRKTQYFEMIGNRAVYHQGWFAGTIHKAPWEAEVDVPAGAGGVLLCQGGDFGGWSFYMLDGKPAYTYNWVGLESYTVTSTRKVPAGKHTIAFDFAYEGGRGGGGTGTIKLDGEKVGEGRIEKTNSNIFGIDESADVGTDENTPVTPAYAKRERFTGTIGRVTIQTTPAKQ